MAQFDDLPDELIVSILSHNVPRKLRKRDDFTAFITSYAASKRLLRLIRYTFFQTFIHDIDLTCIYTTLSRHCSYTQVHSQGALTIRKSFCAQVRQIHIRLHVYYRQSIKVAVDEVQSALRRYKKLKSVRVTLEATSAEVADALKTRVGEVLQEEFRMAKRVEVCLEVDVMGHRVADSVMQVGHSG